MIRLKSNVNIIGIQPHTVMAITIAQGLWERVFPNGNAVEPAPEFVITSILDSAHNVEGAHPTGEAFDLRSRDISAEMQREYRDSLQAILGARWLVLLESDHFHIQVRKEYR